MSTTWGGIDGGAGAPAGQVTARKLIYQATRMLGVLGWGQGNSTAALEDGLAELNQMLDSLSLERLIVEGITRQSYELTAGQSEYLLGDQGERPIRIELAALLQTGLGAEHERPIRVWRTPEPKPGPCITIDSSSAPVMRLWLNPVASGNDELVLYVWGALRCFPDLDTVVTLGPGYALAIRTLLAVHLAPSVMLHTKVPQPLLGEIKEQAAEAKARIKALNVPVLEMSCDAGLVNRGGYNVLTDGY